MDDTLKNYLESTKSLIEKELKGYLEGPFLSENLGRAMRYSVISECKRFRPVLTLASTGIVGGREKKALPFACAIELIHTYSLIHDDLPCMDNDDLRRGKPSSHREFGEAGAVLAGDALLTTAFEIMAGNKTDLPPSIVLKIIKIVAECSGKEGMVGGQQLDIDSENKKIDIEKLKRIHLHKTGKLIQCAILAGAIAGGAGSKDIENLRIYGENLGIAFQITDDILDYTGKIPGKNPRSDVKNSKSTYATLLGVEKSKEILNEKIDIALKSLKPFGDRATILSKLTHYVHERIV